MRGPGGHDVEEAEFEREKARRRNLIWLESLWEGKATSAREENQKEEVLAVFRGLVSESRSERTIREFMPWQPPW